MAEKTNAKPGLLDRIKGGFASFTKYLRDTKGELKKVSWPSKEDTKNNTIVVLVVMVIAAVVMIVLDAVFGGIMGLIIGA